MTKPRGKERKKAEAKFRGLLESAPGTGIGLATVQRIVRRHGLIAEGGHSLQKPFTPEILARKVREALDG